MLTKSWEATKLKLVRLYKAAVDPLLELASSSHKGEITSAKICSAEELVCFNIEVESVYSRAASTLHTSVLARSF